MRHSRINAFLIALISAQIAVATGGSTSAGPAHPANKYCSDRNGIGTTIDEGGWSGTQFGICRLPDNSVISTMTFWEETQKPTIALAKFRVASWRTFQGQSIEMWGKLNCADQGGTVMSGVEHLRPNVKHEFCLFSDNSLIEVWTLLSGRCYYPELAK